MKVQEVKRQIRLMEWAAQIEDRKQSGLTVKQWREENGIHKKKILQPDETSTRRIIRNPGNRQVTALDSTKQLRR